MSLPRLGGGWFAIMIHTYTVRWLSSILAILTLQFVVVASAAREAQNEDSFPVQSTELFTRLLRQYKSLDSLHFKAKVLTTVDYDQMKSDIANGTNSARITIKLSGKHSDEGYYELWLADKRFRIESSLGKDVNVYYIAWDGSQMQYYDRDSESMTVSTNLTDGYAAVPIDPFLAPFEMLKDIQETNAMIHQLIYADLSNPMCQQHLEIYRTNADFDQVVELPGGQLDKRNFFYRVHMISEPFSLPSVIEYVDAFGKLIARTQITYSTRNVNGSVQSWPQSVTRESYSKEGKLKAQQELTIEDRDLDKKINASTFRLDTKRVSHIWDSDQRKFIQRRSEFVERSRVILIAFLLLTSVGAVYAAFRLSRNRRPSG